MPQESGGRHGRGSYLLRNPQNMEVAPSEKGTPWSPAGVCSPSPGLAQWELQGPNFEGLREAPGCWEGGGEWKARSVLTEFDSCSRKKNEDEH